MTDMDYPLVRDPLDWLCVQLMAHHVLDSSLVTLAVETPTFIYKDAQKNSDALLVAQ